MNSIRSTTPEMIFSDSYVEGVSSLYHDSSLHHSLERFDWGQKDALDDEFFFDAMRKESENIFDHVDLYGLTDDVKFESWRIFGCLLTAENAEKVASKSLEQPLLSFDEELKALVNCAEKLMKQANLMSEENLPIGQPCFETKVDAFSPHNSRGSILPNSADRINSQDQLQNLMTTLQLYSPAPSPSPPSFLDELDLGRAASATTSENTLQPPLNLHTALFATLKTISSSPENLTSLAVLKKQSVASTEGEKMTSDEVRIATEKKVGLGFQRSNSISSVRMTPRSLGSNSFASPFSPHANATVPQLLDVKCASWEDEFWFTLNLFQKECDMLFGELKMLMPVKMIMEMEFKTWIHARFAEVAALLPRKLKRNSISLIVDSGAANDPNADSLARKKPCKKPSTSDMNDANLKALTEMITTELRVPVEIKRGLKPKLETPKKRPNFSQHTRSLLKDWIIKRM